MGYCDGKWMLVIIMIMINLVLGLGNVLVKKVFDGGVNYMVIVIYWFVIFILFLVLIVFFWEW